MSMSLVARGNPWIAMDIPPHTAYGIPAPSRAPITDFNSSKRFNIQRIPESESLILPKSVRPVAAVHLRVDIEGLACHSSAARR